MAKMAKKWMPILAAAGVAALVMQGEHDAPGATARGAATAREAATPFFSEVIGFFGDLFMIGRDEVSRQGIDPGRMFQPTDGAGELQPPTGPPDVPSLGGE